MIRTIIVDDEFLVRLGLKNMAAWKRNGFEIVGEASDGTKALELCRNQPVDLVVTDVEMPKMSGIDLIRTLHQEMPHISIIVLSNHRNSEYIRETLRYNRALDYIFKLALDDGELEKTLQHTRKAIELSSASLLPQEDNDKIPFTEKQSAWNQFQSSGIFEDSYSKLFKTDFSTFFYCICIEIWPKNGITHIDSSDKFSLIESMAHDLFEKEQLRFDIFLSENKSCFFLFLEASNDTPAQIKERCKKIKYMNSLFQDSPLAFGISHKQCGICNISHSMNQALHALECSFFHNTPEINFFEAVQGDEQPATIISRHQLTYLLHTQNAEDIKQHLQKYLQQCALSRNSTIEHVKETCFDFIMLLASLLKEISRTTVTTIRYEVVSKWIAESFTVRALEEVLLNCIDTLFIEYSIANRQIISKDVQKALLYIQNNYNKNCRLKDVASYIGMSESYLSYLFKKELGKNLTAYLNEYRIQIAKQLIISSPSALNLIAEQVGYTNYPYFSKVFHSIVGIEASKFKSTYEKKMICTQNHQVSDSTRKKSGNPGQLS